MNQLLLGCEYNNVPEISGLSYCQAFISKTEEQALIRKIDSQIWNNALKRRVQHYGYEYDYKARSAPRDSYLGPLPDFLSSYSKKLEANGFFKKVPDQVIVNEYAPGQGISAHIDCIPCFGEEIASLSLGSSCVMEFSNPKTGQKEELLLGPRSLVILSGEARHSWSHRIPARQSDPVNGLRIKRSRRLSLTFRTMKFN